MAKEVAGLIKLQIKGGAANPSPPVGPALGIKGGSAEPNRKKVAEITWDQVRTIAQEKMPDLNCFTVESAMTLVAGTARSMGITVKGEFPGK